jgi:hypothetical protein
MVEAGFIARAARTDKLGAPPATGTTKADMLASGSFKRAKAWRTGAGNASARTGAGAVHNSAAAAKAHARPKVLNIRVIMNRHCAHKA